MQWLWTSICLYSGVLKFKTIIYFNQHKFDIVVGNHDIRHKNKHKFITPSHVVYFQPADEKIYSIKI
jgi:hypothetical protein